MKKWLCVALAVAMLVSLCGCFEDVTGTIDTGTQAPGESQDAGQQDPSFSTGKAPGESQDAGQQDPTFSMGKATGGTYKNEFLGMSFTLPSGWQFYTEKQIMELNNLTAEYMDDETLEQLENATIIYDMYANNSADGSNINVNLEKISVVQAAIGNLKATLDSQIPAIKTSYKNIGYTDTEVEYAKVTVAGKQYDGLRITARIDNVAFFGTIFCFVKGTYLANVTVCSLQTDKTQDILNQITLE